MIGVLMSLSPAAAAPPPFLPAPLFTGDFETGNFSQWPICQSVAINDACSLYDNSHYSLQVQSAVRRQGRFAARFEVRDGDVPATVPGGERAEVQGGPETGGSEGADLWYQWSTQFSTTFPANHASQGWGLVSQWHGEVDGPPPLGMYVDVGDGQWGLRVNAQTSPGQFIASYVPWRTGLAQGSWQDIKIHIKWSTDDRVGFVELWHNGIRQTFTDAPCAGQDRCYVRTLIPLGSTTYFKQGYYRDPNVTGTGILYHDGFTVAPTESGLGAL
ncbi:polysaccharide lyase [Rhodococcus sp. NPDC059234]|uniref:polysaccharide lyase n=1 Tax=Rhodococcus sp. NPDC059234 TaxID=3346781 RepID=UPI0036719E33